eukprot:7123661-Prymnesium_polylepis.1
MGCGIGWVWVLGGRRTRRHHKSRLRKLRQIVIIDCVAYTHTLLTPPSLIFVIVDLSVLGAGAKAVARARRAVAHCSGLRGPSVLTPSG